MPGASGGNRNPPPPITTTDGDYAVSHTIDENREFHDFSSGSSSGASSDGDGAPPQLGGTGNRTSVPGSVKAVGHFNSLVEKNQNQGDSDWMDKGPSSLGHQEG